MLHCREAYEGLLEGQIAAGVGDGSLRPEFGPDAPAPYARLARRCWQADPE